MASGTVKWFECDQNLWDAVGVGYGRTPGVASQRAWGDQREPHAPIRHRRAAMTSNPEPIGQQLPHAFHHLLASVAGPEARAQTASTGALPRCRRRLALGAALWRLFGVRRATVRPAAPVTAPAGARLPAHAQRPTTADAVVGKVCVARHDVPAPGQPGRCPLDAALSVPARGAAELLRAWAV